MRQLEGLASVLDEEQFERKLQRLAALPPKYKRSRLSSLNSNENARIFNHRISNISIESSRLFEAEWRKENPDGEYPET